MTDSDTSEVDTVEEVMGIAAPGTPGGAIAPLDERYPVIEDKEHPGPREYVLIAMVLVVLTAVEVAVSYMDSLPSNLIIVILAAMAACKFFLVCAWYMHMKQDAPFFRRVFTIGLIGATIVYGIVLLMFASSVLLS